MITTLMFLELSNLLLFMIGTTLVWPTLWWCEFVGVFRAGMAYHLFSMDCCGVLAHHSWLLLFSSFFFFAVVFFKGNAESLGAVQSVEREIESIDARFEVGHMIWCIVL